MNEVTKLCRQVKNSILPWAIWNNEGDHGPLFNEVGSGYTIIHRLLLDHFAA